MLNKKFKHNIINWTKEDIENLLLAFYYGNFTTRNLPKDLYYATAYTLKKGAYTGFKGTPVDFEWGSPNRVMITELRENIYMFSGAKTYQQARQYTDLLVEDGAVVPLPYFKKKALEKFDVFNSAYLEAEYNTAIGQAENASKWIDIESDKVLFPYLQYDAVMDENTSEVCRTLENVVRPVDDKFWDTHSPLNHFRCRCKLNKISRYEDVRLTPAEQAEKINVKATKETDKPFLMNPGRDKIIFKKDHPYFIVPKKDKEFAKTNFGLPIPKTD